MSRCRNLALAAVASTLSIALPAFATEPRAVIELFTSQGCSSCPPADRLLADLTHDPTLIPLTLAIDYWDYLGWKDTLALAGHTNRQKAYSHVRGDRDVYTPQAVINGTAQVLGSDRAAIEQAIAQSRHNGATLALPLTLTIEGERLTVSAPASSSHQASAEVWLCPLTKAVQVAIGRGENTGHTFTYHNVVRRWVKLGTWTGEAATWSIPIAEFKTEGVNAVAVVLQDGVATAPGAMIGAVTASLDEDSVAAHKP
jgi:hypothetical protein